MLRIGGGTGSTWMDGTLKPVQPDSSRTRIG